ncbi:MAG: transglutaminase-like domain-containing protein, partial [Marinirhabdus sp.]|nr:transglutaminase-like domain-containing protein [Marinirhabdus sp.]
MKLFFTALFVGLFIFNVTAQRNDEISEHDASDAIAYKLQFPDEHIVNREKRVEISFDFDKRNKQVAVIERTSADLMNLNTSYRIQYPVFYDAESEVGEFEVLGRDGKRRRNVSYSVQDEFLKQEDLFHTDYRVKYVNLNFPLLGYRHMVNTEKTYHDIKYFTSFYFTDAYRIADGELNIIVPDWLELEVKEFNFEGYSIEKSETQVKEGKSITYTYKRIAPRATDANTPGPSYVYPHLLFIAKSFYDGESKNILFNSTDDLYAWYNGLVKNVTVDPSAYAAKVVELTKDATSDKEKIENIYYWVQDNIRYIAFEDGLAGFQPDSPQNVFNKRYGDCKGMAFLIKAMLEEAGFDARLVWIGTDRLAYDYSFPSLSVDNHMICAVNLDNETIFLDGTEKYNRFGEYATRIQNKEAMVQNKDSYSLLTVSDANGDQNSDVTRLHLSIDGATLTGKAERFYESESRVQFQNVFNSLEKGDQTEILSNYLSGGNSNYIIKEVVPFDPEKRDKNLSL